jgi:hypothetical protein
METTRTSLLSDVLTVFVSLLGISTTSWVVKSHGDEDSSETKLSLLARSGYNFGGIYGETPVTHKWYITTGDPPDSLEINNWETDCRKKNSFPYLPDSLLINNWGFVSTRTDTRETGQQTHTPLWVGSLSIPGRRCAKVCVRGVDGLHWEVKYMSIESWLSCTWFFQMTEWHFSTKSCQKKSGCLL